jgi:adenylyltransferase/sulfurtransferase
VKVKGHSFREFVREVVPRLDGRHTLDAICAEVGDVFDAADLHACFRLLAEHNLIEEGAADPAAGAAASRREPQLNFFREISPERQHAQDRLARATVAIVGVGGAGAHLAASLAAAGVGTLRCVDPLKVSLSDPYFAPLYLPADEGMLRVQVAEQRLQAIAPGVRIVADARPIAADSDIEQALEGVDFAVCCADPAQATLFYRMNRACLVQRLPWSSCCTSALEVIVGPTVRPYQTACFLCYRMRSVACAEDPDTEFSWQRFLDQRRQDDSGRRENLVFAAGMAGHLLGLEVVKELTGIVPTPTAAQIAVIDLLELNITRHLVLRKPWCPACWPSAPAAAAESPA